MLLRYNLNELAYSINVQLFVLAEFLEQHGIKTSPYPSELNIFIPTRHYSLILSAKEKLKERESFLVEQNATIISWLEEEIKNLGIPRVNTKKFNRLYFLKSELRDAKTVRKKREVANKTIISEVEKKLSSETPSLAEQLRAPVYKIYNGSGFVTSTQDRSRAIELADQFKGTAYDECRRIVR